MNDIGFSIGVCLQQDLAAGLPAMFRLEHYAPQVHVLLLRFACRNRTLRHHHRLHHLLLLSHDLSGVTSFVACVIEAALRLLNVSCASHSRTLVSLLGHRAKPRRSVLTDIMMLPRVRASHRAHGAHRLEHVIRRASHVAHHNRALYRDVLSSSLPLHQLDPV